jgi:excisionase family DNA binding protein
VGAVADALTGLPSSFLFLDRLQQALARGSGEVAVHCVGVEVGAEDELAEEILQALAARLRAELAPHATLARMDGDVFAVLIEGGAGERGAIEVAGRLLRAAAIPLVVGDREVPVGASVGIAVTAGGSTGSAADLLRDAGAAMTRARARGGRGYELFDLAKRRRLTEELRLEEELRGALERRELELHYQPVVALADGAILGAEGLVRWRHPARGLLPARSFIAAAERSGLILPLGRWILQEACRQLACWTTDPEFVLPYVSVNLSGHQLEDAGLPEELARVLLETGVAPARLSLELSEQALTAGSREPAGALQRLKSLGVRLALDDFGTGVSSLNHLQTFPIDALKIDGSMIADLPGGGSAAPLLTAILSLAAALGLEVVAEGVEAAEQAHALRTLGCVAAQGHLLGVPAPPATLEAALRNGLPFPLEPAAEEPVPPPGEGAAGIAEATVTLGQAAASLEVSASTLRRWADDGRIRVVRTPGGHRRFPVSELRRLAARRARSVVRVTTLPSAPLPLLARLIGRHEADLAEQAVRGLYEGPRTGWFGDAVGRRHLTEWAAALRAAAESGEFEGALAASRVLAAQADYRGTSLLERHGLVERYGEIVIRRLQDAGAPRDEILSARRVLVRLRQEVLAVA